MGSTFSGPGLLWQPYWEDDLTNPLGAKFGCWKAPSDSPGSFQGDWPHQKPSCGGWEAARSKLVIVHAMQTLAYCRSKIDLPNHFFSWMNCYMNLQGKLA